MHVYNYVVRHTSMCSLAHNACVQSITVKIVIIDYMLMLNVARQTKAQADTEWRRETRK